MNQLALWVAAASLLFGCGGSTHSDGSGKGGSSGGGAAGASGLGGASGSGGASGAGGSSTCAPPSPAGCVQNACPPDMVCDTSIGCTSPACSCDLGKWVCTNDCGGGVCVPVGQDCADLSKQIASALNGNLCTTIVRLSYTDLAPKGWQVVCGFYASIDEAGARVKAQAATGFGQAGKLLGGPIPQDAWVFWEAPGDFGGVGVVSARSSLAVFGGGIVWMGTGKITHPTDWRDPASLGFGCASSGSALPVRGFDLESGTLLGAEESNKASSVVWSSALLPGISMVHSVLDVVVLFYPPTVGALDPNVAEYVVLVNSGWLE